MFHDNNNARSRMIYNSDGSLYFTYNKVNNPDSNNSFLSKLTTNGNVDTAFGISRILQLPYIALTIVNYKNNPMENLLRIKK